MNQPMREEDPDDRRLLFTDPLPLGGRLVMVVIAGGLLVAPWKVFVAHEVAGQWASLLAVGAIVAALALIVAAFLIRALVCEFDLRRRRVTGGVDGFAGLGLHHAIAFDDIAEIGVTRRFQGDRPDSWMVWVRPRRGRHLRVAGFPDAARAEALRDDLRKMVGLDA